MAPILRSVVAQGLAAIGQVHRKSLPTLYLSTENGKISLGQPVRLRPLTSFIIGFSVYAVVQSYNCWKEYPALKRNFEAQAVRSQRYDEMIAVIEASKRSSSSLAKE